jgi:hypothetical protein
MSLIERFTRDSASKYIWAGLALVAAIGLAYSVSHRGRVLDQESAVAEGRAVGYVEGVLSPRLDSRELAAPISGPQAESLEAVVRRSILDDERVSRVRIWSIDGTLLFSTDPSDHSGSDEGLNDPVLRDASREGPLTRTDLSDGGGADDPERTLLRTYVPLGTASVAEIDQTDAGTVGPIRTAWFYYQLLAGGVLLLLLVMTAISLRDPIAPINTGIPFAASSIPRGFSLIDDERLAAVQEVYRLASERVARLQEKLDESEEARRGLESYIQQKLSRIESADAARPAASAASDPSATAPPATEPTVVHVPESDVVSASLDAWATAPAGPLARASRAQKPTPTVSPEEPVAEKPKRSLKRSKVKPEQQTSEPTEVSETHPETRQGPEPEELQGATASTAAPAVDIATSKRGATMKSGHGGTHKWHPLCDVLGCENAEGRDEGAKAATSRPRSKSPRRQAASAPATAPAEKAPAPATAPEKAPATAPPVAARGGRRSKAPGSSPKGGAAPAPQPAAPPRSEIDEAEAHAAALETFIRLTESDRQPHDTDPADQSEIRAALARTAARKKPGGDRLQPHDVPEESLGGPPKGRG